MELLAPDRRMAAHRKSDRRRDDLCGLDFVNELVSHGGRCVSRGSEVIQTSRICIALGGCPAFASKLENR
jgi:hypothetical protein